MRFSTSGMLRGLILAGAASLLAACGGGGGGSGGGLPGGPTPSNEYEISLTTDRTTLPLNLDRVRPGLDYSGTGRDAIFTTMLTVSAWRKNTNDPIPSGEDVFGCNLISGLESGSLMYLNGDEDTVETVTILRRNPVTGDLEEFEVEGVPSFFRSVALDSNAGSATFHFHATDKVGTATIRCAVTDPQSGVSKSKDIQINVGGTSSGSPAMVQVTRQALNYLYIQGLNGPTQMVLQATIRDEAGQPITDGSGNMCARIVPNTGSTAEDSARLFTGTANVGVGQWASTGSIDGEARFSLNSGFSIGPIAVEVRASRDGSAPDCNAFDIRNVAVIPVVSNNPFDPISIVASPTALEVYVGEPLVDSISASGGTPPYQWRLVSGSFPPGISFGVDGGFVGTPTVPGSYTFTVEVEDSALIDRSRLRETITMVVLQQLAITTPSVPAGTFDLSYRATILASGGKSPIVFSASGLPSGLSMDTASGVISGIVAAPDPTCTEPEPPEPPEPAPEFTPPAPVTTTFSVTATDVNTRSATRNYSVTFSCP